MSDVRRGPFVLQSTRDVYTNPWIHVREDRVLRPEGKEGVFGVIEMQGGSTVLAMDDHTNVYLVKEYKYAIDRESIELVSGGLDKGERPIDAAMRELKEELGVEATTWIDFGLVHPFTTIIHSPNHMFLALGVHDSKDSRMTEDSLQVLTVPLQEALRMVIDCHITHAASCVLILRAHKYLMESKQ
jgi:8-oxo-dGTP pyrophosphatase MutT (NUDIX family)